MVTSKATGKWRATYEDLGTYPKVPNLIQKGLPNQQYSLVLQIPRASQKANTPKSNKVTLKFFHIISGRQYRLRITIYQDISSFMLPVANY